MTDFRRQLGKWGESVASVHLEAKGYHIVQRNWRCAFGEIDIVAEDAEELVFIEVKTRRGNKMGTPEEGLTKAKSEKLKALALSYVAENDLDSDWRIDLVAIEIDDQGKLVRTNHLRNAVLGW